MFNILNIVGLEKDEAVKILNSEGIEKVNVIINSKYNELCDTQIVCSAKEHLDGSVTLICGEFYLNLKG